MVKESQPIPASMASVKNLFGFIKDAPVTIQFEYKNQKLQITFPAGTDYTPVLNDTDTMYGFYGVAAKLGLMVAER